MPKRHLSLDLICHSLHRITFGGKYDDFTLVRKSSCCDVANRECVYCFIYLAPSILAHTSLLMFGRAIPDNEYKSSTYVDLRHPVIPWHVLFSSGSSMSACEDLAHTGAAYSVIAQHRDSAVVLIVNAFVPHFKLSNFFKRLLRVATLILVFGMCCLYLYVLSKVTPKYLGLAVFSRSTPFHYTFNVLLASLFRR